MDARQTLIEELRRHALVIGEVTLTSGATASYYVDAKRAILRPAGFRALAERSSMADRVKDSGAVSMFPQMADTWRTQVRSLDGWSNFHQKDFERLHKEYGVNWVILQEGPSEGLDCPYQNSAVMVCQIP